MVKRNSTEVMLADTRPGIAQAVNAIFEHFGGGGKLLRSSRDVYIKVNAVGLEPYVYTDPEVLRQTILYFQKCGARKIYVIENCTQANFTRLVFQAIGYLKICRETGAIPVFLDETPAVPIFLEGHRGVHRYLAFRVRTTHRTGRRKPLPLPAQAQNPLHVPGDPIHQESVWTCASEEPHCGPQLSHPPEICGHLPCTAAGLCPDRRPDRHHPWPLSYDV